MLEHLATMAVRHFGKAGEYPMEEVAAVAAAYDIDELMNYVMQLLGLCVNGADPVTCEPEPHDCGCDCESCHSDCHH